jgi:hypothetical protein
MGLNLMQFKYSIVKPVIRMFPAPYNSDAAVNLLTGTALVESGLEDLVQLPNGPALGLWQMEPATHYDCWTHFLDYEKNDELVKIAKSVTNADDLSLIWYGDLTMVWNLRYACFMARVKYIRAPNALPAADDALALAAYHKTWYNTALGAADVQKNTPLFQEAIDA